MRFRFILALLFASATNRVWAGDIETGKLEAASCITVHIEVSHGKDNGITGKMPVNMTQRMCS